jgi:hypothetical protein
MIGRGASSAEVDGLLLRLGGVYGLGSIRYDVEAAQGKNSFSDN